MNKQEIYETLGQTDEGKESNNMNNKITGYTGIVDELNLLSEQIYEDQVPFSQLAYKWFNVNVSWLRTLVFRDMMFRDAKCKHPKLNNDISYNQIVPENRNNMFNQIADVCENEQFEIEMNLPRRVRVCDLKTIFSCDFLLDEVINDNNSIIKYILSMFPDDANNIVEVFNSLDDHYKANIIYYAIIKELVFHKFKLTNKEHMERMLKFFDVGHRDYHYFMSDKDAYDNIINKAKEILDKIDHELDKHMYLNLQLKMLDLANVVDRSIDELYIPALFGNHINREDIKPIAEFIKYNYGTEELRKYLKNDNEALTKGIIGVMLLNTSYALIDSVSDNI